MVNLKISKIISKSNLFAYNLKPWKTRSLVVLVTGVKEETTEEEKNTLGWILESLQLRYADMVASQLDAKFIDLDDYSYLAYKRLEVVYRPVLDVEKNGILVNGCLPFIHIHLGHGSKMSGKESEISSDESGESDYFKSSKYSYHLDKANGECWIGLFPVCNGYDFAMEISNSQKIHATWGSVDESPVTCRHALEELPGALAREYRPFYVLSRAINANAS